MSDEIQDNLVTLLKSAYKKVDWKRMKGRSSYDVFQHRLKVASYSDSVKKFVEKLCKGLSLQSVDVDPELIDRLESNCDEVLRRLREETVYYTLLAAKRR